jgi:hypothetical protein
LGFVADVGFDADSRSSGFGLDPLGRAPSSITVYIDGDDDRSGLGEAVTNCFTDTAATAGHYCDLVLESI